MNDPGAELPALPREGCDAGLHLSILPGMGVVLAVDAVGGCVLGDHQKFPHAGLDKFLRLAQDRVDGAARKSAAHVGDDAEAASMVAAFGDLEIAEMARRKLQLRRGHQIPERIRVRRHRPVYRVEHLLVLVRAGDREHRRMGAADILLLRPQTSGDDDAAVLAQGLADGLEAFGLRAVEKTAGVHAHRVRSRIVAGDRVALRPQTGEDALAVHERLGAPEGHHADGGLARTGDLADLWSGGEVRAEVWRVLAHGRSIQRAPRERKRPGRHRRAGRPAGRGHIPLSPSGDWRP